MWQTQGNSRIQVFDGRGNFLTSFGSSGSADGQFDVSTTVAVDPTMGSVYVVDTFNDRIQVFDSSGRFITEFGIQGSGNGQFNLPAGVAVNPSTGSVYCGRLQQQHTGV